MTARPEVVLVLSTLACAGCGRSEMLPSGDCPTCGGREWKPVEAVGS